MGSGSGAVIHLDRRQRRGGSAGDAESRRLKLSVGGVMGLVYWFDCELRQENIYDGHFGLVSSFLYPSLLH